MDNNNNNSNNTFENGMNQNPNVNPYLNNRNMYQNNGGMNQGQPMQQQPMNQQQMNQGHPTQQQPMQQQQMKQGQPTQQQPMQQQQMKQGHPTQQQPMNQQQMNQGYPTQQQSMNQQQMNQGHPTQQQSMQQQQMKQGHPAQQQLMNQQQMKQEQPTQQQQLNQAQVVREKPKKKKGKKIAAIIAVPITIGLITTGVLVGLDYTGFKFDSSSQNNSVKLSTTSTKGKAKNLQDVSDVVDEVMPSIVAITNLQEVQDDDDYYGYYSRRGSKQQASAGSGIIIKQNDTYIYIVTNNHVVADSKSLKIKFCDKAVVKAEIQGQDESNDLAVVRVKISDIKKSTYKKIKLAKLGDSKKLSVGEPTIAIGNALGYGQSVTTGVVSALGRSVQGKSEDGDKASASNLIQTDAAINPGNSGGALLNSKGEVIGINSAKTAGQAIEGVGFAIPMEDVKPIVEDLISKEKIDESERGYLGINGNNVTEDYSAMLDIPKGVYVTEVQPGSAAEAAGIQKDDVIVGVNGSSVSTIQELQQKLSNCKVGDKVKIKIARDDGTGYKETEVEVTLGAKNQ
ncbi:S1C family serine protease [Lachnobacterium bovis]|uniref:Serine protease Do n=1 Tax=Lachnobacterium bovis DSM 14045 TaxID=1122142 RepID=A0A1H3JPJ0_9FIRM|nr:trypsin-like peptidase domain-containing protein [Lachnobacterium bovis]SDY41821.1 serine protease Do [Lachnobacterium bovis DSM 14045]